MESNNSQELAEAAEIAAVQTRLEESRTAECIAMICTGNNQGNETRLGSVQCCLYKFMGHRMCQIADHLKILSQNLTAHDWTCRRAASVSQ